MSESIKDKYIGTMLLHALGDTIGFKNGQWEFFASKNNYGQSLDKLYEFIDLGGINYIDLSGWNVSDDTLLHMAVAKSLALEYNDIQDLENQTVKNFINTYENILVDEKNNKRRLIGKTTSTHLEMLKNGQDWKTFEFDVLGGGNGVAMRSNCIGLVFHNEENRSKLIEYSIKSGKMTHNNPIGWLGGLVVALFTSFAIENIIIEKWIPKMLELLDSESVRNYLNKDNVEEIRSYDKFKSAFRTYYDTRFKNEQVVHTKAYTNLIQRQIFYNSLFEDDEMSKQGQSGYSAVIVAYDCLLDARDNWEKLIIYCVMNIFDSDTIGAIACGLFGTLYGTKNVPENNLKYLEQKERLRKLGLIIYKKYYLNEKIIINK